MADIHMFTIDDSPATVRSAWYHFLEDLAWSLSNLGRPAVSPYVWELQGLGPLIDALVKNRDRWPHTRRTANVHHNAMDDTLADLAGEAITLLELFPHGDLRDSPLLSRTGPPSRTEPGTPAATEVDAAAPGDAIEKDLADPEPAQRALQAPVERRKAIDTLNAARKLLLDKLLDFERANPKLSRLFEGGWAYGPFQPRPDMEALLKNRVPSRGLDREERERRDRELVEEAARRALADLSAGTAKRYVSSGIMGRFYRHDWDPETGLLLIDTGCLVSSDATEYNRVVAEWIARHGVPPGSMKPRFVSQEIVEAALLSAKPLQRGDEIPAPDGRTIRRTAPDAGDRHGTHQLRVVSTAGHTTWYAWLSGIYERMDVAWSSPGSWFVYFTGNGTMEHVSAWHVDADGDGVLQSFTVRRASAPPAEGP